MTNFVSKGPGFYARPGHFRIGFENGWMVSVYFRPNGYCENYDFPLEGLQWYGCKDAEVRIEPPDEDFKRAHDFILTIKDSNWVYDHTQGTGILGYVEPEDLAQIIAAVAAIEKDA